MQDHGKQDHISRRKGPKTARKSEVNHLQKGKLTWIWVEEATELLSEDIDILDDRLRGNLDDLNPNLYYQITMTFNPVSATHWIKARYFDKSDPDVLTHHSTYKTNRFIDAGYFRRMERRAMKTRKVIVFMVLVNGRTAA